MVGQQLKGLTAWGIDTSGHLPWESYCMEVSLLTNFTARKTLEVPGICQGFTLEKLATS